jgi:hypothetical protein
VDVGAEPHVVGQIPAVVIGILVDRDVVVVPVPIIAVVIVVGCDLEVRVLEPEALAVPSLEAINVAGAEAESKASVLPGTINAVVGIVATGIVADPPPIVRMDVGSVGMLGVIAERGTLVAWLVLLRVFTAILAAGLSGRSTNGLGIMNRRGAALRNVSVADVFRAPLCPTTPVLRKSGNTEDQRETNKARKLSHVSLGDVFRARFPLDSTIAASIHPSAFS